VAPPGAQLYLSGPLPPLIVAVSEPVHELAQVGLLVMAIVGLGYTYITTFLLVAHHVVLLVAVKVYVVVLVGHAETTDESKLPVKPDVGAQL